MNWEEADGKLKKDFNFEDFNEALNFINAVADIADEMNHHPDIFLHDYRKVTFILSTHKENKITGRDRELSEKIDEEFKKYKRIIL